MGCDIHIIAEVKSEGVWKPNTKKIFPNPWYKPGVEDGFQKDEFTTNPEDGRSYDWFSILADVRNGHGFAGISTGQGFNIIAEPRGIPEDASQQWLEICERWEGDMHSHSYLTLDDFDKFDWNQVTMKTGVVTLEEYVKLRGTNECPEAWSGGVGGGNTITISEQEADTHLSNPKKILTDKSVYVQYNWPVLYSEWFKFKRDNIIEKLRELSNEYPEGVRIVFGFDN